MELVGPGSIQGDVGDGKRVQGARVYSLWSGNLLETLNSKVMSFYVLCKDHFVAV